jgi:hypothetical protein
MNILVKTVKAGQLPDGWQTEMGLAADSQVRVVIEAVSLSRAPEEVDALLADLRKIKPVSIEGDITSFIRSERDRIDGRNPG